MADQKELVQRQPDGSYYKGTSPIKRVPIRSATESEREKISMAAEQHKRNMERDFT